MSDGSGALNDVYAKLDWATTPHDEMLDRFEEFAKPGGGDERPYGIKFHEHDRPGGLVVARFIVEEPVPVEMSLLAADLVHNTRAALDHVLARLKDRFGGDVSRRLVPDLADARPVAGERCRKRKSQRASRTRRVRR